MCAPVCVAGRRRALERGCVGERVQVRGGREEGRERESGDRKRPREIKLEKRNNKMKG